MTQCCTALPPYTDSSPPIYTAEPAQDEERLQQTPRRSLIRPTGIFVNKSGSTALVFLGQEPGATVPSYGPDSPVKGRVDLVGKREAVSEVKIRLEGKIHLMSSEGGAEAIQTFRDSYTLWRFKRDECPASLHFSCPLPLTFERGGETFALPPTYDVSFPGVPGLFVSSFYTITLIIVKGRLLKGYWSQTKSISLRFNYQLRTRSLRSVASSSQILQSIKTTPEEWRQISATMKPRPRSTLTPIHCNLFIPSSQTFGLEETIPFHVQLIGHVFSLREFLLPQPSSTKTQKCGAAISVSLLRQVLVEVKGVRSWRDTIIAEGKVCPLPPQLRNSECFPPPDEILDWEGEVRCRSDISVGSFDSGVLAVKDYLVLSLVPPNPQKGCLLPLRHRIPIKLDNVESLVDYM